MPSRYFAGRGEEMGRVSALGSTTFAELAAEVIATPIRLPLTRAQFFALPKKDRTAPNDQQRAKRVRYITPGAFRESPSPRQTEHVVRANLIALDIDDSNEAQRLLTERWAALEGFSYAVWYTASSTPDAPRLRVLVAANGLPVNKYQSAARTVAEMLGIAEISYYVTFQPVQPMFLPTVFADSVESPVVTVVTDGAEFASYDILASGESALEDEVDDVVGDSDVGDLAFLREPLEKFSIEDAQGMLKFLDPDMAMQPWIEVAAGLKHQFGEEGFDLWHDWSEKGSKYDTREELEYRWKTLKGQTPNRAPITIRSVMRMAVVRGWENSALAHRLYNETLSWIKGNRNTEELLDQGAQRIARVAPSLRALERKSLMMVLRDRLAMSDVKVLLADIKKDVHRLEIASAKQTGFPAWAKNICFVTANNFFYRYTTDRKFKPEVLDLLYTSPEVSDEKTMRPRDYLMQVAGIPQVENLLYEPARKERIFQQDGVPYCNTYRRDYPTPDPERADEAGEIFWDHLCRLVAEENFRKTLVDFLAYHVQHPGKKVRWGVLLQGTQGCGKTAIAVAMTAVLGRRNVMKVAANNVLKGDYNDWAYGHQLVVLEEIRVTGENRHAIMDKLKPCLTDDVIGYAVKFESYRSVPNITNYLMFTNSHDALAVTHDDRRYFVLASPLQNRADLAGMDAAYFIRLYSMISGNAGGLRAWFEQWPISPDFNPEGRAPMTPYLTQLAENAASPLTAAVKTILEDQPWPLVREDLVSVAHLRELVMTGFVRDFSDQGLAHVLRDLGYMKLGRFTIHGQKHILYGTRQFDDVVKTAVERLEFL